MPPQVPTVELNSGTRIPQFGLGVFQIPPDQTEAAVRTALEVGYRHIDTAEMYGNEREVGAAVAASGLPRDEIFVTSKLNNRFQSYDQAMEAFDGTMEALGLDQIDLFIIHWPLPTLRDFMDVWRALEKVHADGRARAIGVSNFQVAHLERLLKEGDVVPAVNQIELHPYLAQEELRAFGADHGIATESWSPIAQGKVLDDPTVRSIAESTGRTPSQVVLRWHVQLGCIVFPKTVRRERMEENISIFDFELSDEDMARISGLDRDERTGPDPDTFDYVPK